MTASNCPPADSPGMPSARWQRWLLAARPKTLPLTLTPVLTGMALALAETGRLAPLIGLATLIAAVAIQVGTNLYNDAVDFERGTDTPQRLGPERAAAQGWFSAREIKLAAHLMFALAFLLGVILLARGGWPILLIGLASLAAGYAYTGGPRPIAYGPFGELYVLAFFGIAAVAGTYYLQTLALAWSALATGVALGLPAAAVLVVNNLRDLDTDRAAGRLTLCHYLGRNASRALYAVLLIAPLPVLLAADLPGARWPLLLTLPLALTLIVRLPRQRSGLALNVQLARTAQYQIALGALLMFGFIWN